ncbi:hypothetical protein [Enterobacter sp. Bisph1]|nr:hypothetical protein [Enterobacter sp. Bisph1]
MPFKLFGCAGMVLCSQAQGVNLLITGIGMDKGKRKISHGAP